MTEKKVSPEESLEKRKLFFDKSEQFYIEFNLDEKTTCQNIYDDNKEEIIKIIKLLNKDLDKNFDLDIELEDDNYYFCLTQPKVRKENINEKDLLSVMIDLKLKLEENVYKILLNNQKSIICFLGKNKSKINLRKNARSLFVLEKDIYEDTQDSKLQANTVKENISEGVLIKNTIFFYENKNKNFVKKDVIIDYEKISITKENKVIYINRIINFKYFIYDSEEFKKNDIKGDKMFGYITFDTNEKESYLFGHKKENIYKKFVNSIKCGLNNYNISLIDVKIDNDIYSTKSGLFAIYHLIVDNCFLIKEILSNVEKRKIFMEVFPEKKIGEIIDIIIEDKSLNKKEEYLESWTNFKQILAYIEPYKENKNKDKKETVNEFFKILQKINVNKYKEVLNKTNEALQSILTNIKKNANKENGNGNSNNNFQNDLNKALKELLKDNLFDELFYYIYNLFILPFFEKVNKNLKEGESPQNKSLIRKKFQLLLALYYFKFFDLDFHYLGDKDDIRSASMFFK